MNQLDVRNMLAWAKSVSWQSVRPWSQFAGKFRVPEMEYSKLEEQLIVNLLHFSGNYLLITLLILLFMSLSSPALLVLLLVCFCAVVFMAVPPQKLRPSISRTLPKDEHRVLAGLGVALALLWVCGYLVLVLWALVAGALVAVVHALLRPRTYRADFSHWGAQLQYKINRIAQDMDGGGAGVGMGGDSGGAGRGGAMGVGGGGREEDMVEAGTPSIDSAESGGVAATASPTTAPGALSTSATASAASYSAPSMPMPQVGGSTVPSAMGAVDTADLPRPGGRQRKTAGKAD